ncbi:tRNA-specific adenosine deaminase subunit TAD2 [Kluyveromyces marxianus]|uniref:tRNA(adenine(34)) deaminase n=2 Tax=Kluyveromyces marxianus TaxID=4911 RepID=W0T8E9_KLUMD|nr:tRNA-specific adenosine deaminase subunit TAD2 [Kluyveromyces marxianus DMKU3-1042]QGN15415.1 tRNA-specific adenosine deaminase subunit TAD2 [Kluyveromyces marxianus]BAO39700.1 tRNA-specific adenosine deaminase subunit TAD2 [Kluyveromyces marxianus DMKU3-1042]BAP71184.1 tRNA-specific adenosine deaminase subunit TAD2 [Kluyveromyces marxianus]
MDKDIQHMRTAIKLAKYALDHNETPVACIFVHSKLNKVIAYGMNGTNESISGTSHAEFMGIKQIQDKFGLDPKVFSNIILYVTVEPCIMCASALKQLGIKKVVFGCGNDRFGGNGSILSIHNDTSTVKDNIYVSIPGILRKEAIMLLRYFYVRENERAPKPRAKKDRKLDKEVFPAIEWSKYLTREDFIQEFGKENVQLYDSNSDVFKEVDWKLIDSNYDERFLDTMLNEISSIEVADVDWSKKSKDS